MHNPLEDVRRRVNHLGVPSYLYRGRYISERKLEAIGKRAAHAEHHREQALAGGGAREVARRRLNWAQAWGRVPVTDWPNVETDMNAWRDWANA